MLTGCLLPDRVIYIFFWGGIIKGRLETLSAWHENECCLDPTSFFLAGYTNSWIR